MSYLTQHKTSPMRKLFVDINFLSTNEHSLGLAPLCSISVVILKCVQVWTTQCLESSSSYHLEDFASTAQKEMLMPLASLVYLSCCLLPHLPSIAALSCGLDPFSYCTSMQLYTPTFTIFFNHTYKGTQKPH